MKQRDVCKRFIGATLGNIYDGIEGSGGQKKGELPCYHNKGLS